MLNDLRGIGLDLLNFSHGCAPGARAPNLVALNLPVATDGYTAPVR